MRSCGGTGSAVLPRVFLVRLCFFQDLFCLLKQKAPQLRIAMRERLFL